MLSSKIKVNKVILTVIFLLGWTNIVCQPDVEWHIKKIRELFKLINDRSATVEPVVLRSDTINDHPLEIKSWSFKGNEIKVQTTAYQKNREEVTDYYFGPEGLIFIFSQQFFKDEFNQPYVRENRYYFRDEETMIRWLDENKKEVDPSGPEFSKKAEDLWNELNWTGEIFFMLSTKNDNSEEDEKIRIRDTYFYGIGIGQKIKDVSKNLEKGILKTGEGTFEVYYIKDREGARLGYIPVESEYVLSIVITTQGAVTWDGLKVGSTFGELEETFGSVEVHGSEIEGRTYVEYGNMSFLLDAYHYSYDVDESSIPKETKIRAIIIRSPA
ncbi:MAG: hypothetical protein AAF363_21295 [Bacteroidota bacterium]